MSAALGYGTGLGLLLALLGVLTYRYAPRVGPNPIFGLRTLASMSSREVWDRSNRLGGLLLAAAGVITVLAGVVVHALGVRGAGGVLAVSGVMLAAVLAGAASSVAYASVLARGRYVERVPPPVRMAPRHLLPTTALLLAGVAIVAVVYPLLPEGPIATHFDITGTPDGWMGRAGATASLLGLLGGTWLLHLLVLLGMARIAWPPLLARADAPIPPETALRVVNRLFAAVMAINVLVTADVLAYAVRNVHVIPTWALVLLALALVLLALAPARTLIGVAQRQARS